MFFFTGGCKQSAKCAVFWMFKSYLNNLSRKASLNAQHGKERRYLHQLFWLSVCGLGTSYSAQSGHCQRILASRWQHPRCARTVLPGSAAVSLCFLSSCQLCDKLPLNVWQGIRNRICVTWTASQPRHLSLRKFTRIVHIWHTNTQLFAVLGEPLRVRGGGGGRGDGGLW